MKTAIQHDRHPITGKRFRNIFEMRNVKLASLLGCANRGINVAYIPHEEMAADSEAVLNRVAEGFELPAVRNYQSVTESLGGHAVWSRRDKRAPDSISDEDMAFLRAELDLEQEAILGYSY